MPIMLQHTALFKVYEHEVRVDFSPAQHKGEAIRGYFNCHTCSLSEVQVKAMEFMLTHGVRKLDVDGCQIQRTR